MYEELQFAPLEQPPFPPTADGTAQNYSENQILSHLEAVYQFNYVPKNLPRPKIHFVVLTDEEGASLNDSNSAFNLQGMAMLRKVSSAYRGSLEYLRGSKKIDQLFAINPELGGDGGTQ